MYVYTYVCIYMYYIDWLQMRCLDRRHIRALAAWLEGSWCFNDECALMAYIAGIESDWKWTTTGIWDHPPPPLPPTPISSPNLSSHPFCSPFLFIHCFLLLFLPLFYLFDFFILLFLSSSSSSSPPPCQPFVSSFNTLSTNRNSYLFFILWSSSPSSLLHSLLIFSFFSWRQ